MNKKKKNLILLFGVIAAEFFLVALVVWFFDPFYQYHSPFGELQPVFNDRDNQMPGSVRVMDYDSVLMGSSMVENCDSSFLDEQYGGHFLKIIRASGSVADLLYYLEMAQEQHDLKNVFWCMDLTALSSLPTATFTQENENRYLHTKTVLDDSTYLWNKDILFITIPTAMAYESIGRDVGGHAYDWSEGKEFSARKAMEAYEKSGEILEEQDYSMEIEDIYSNVEAVAQQIQSHPDTTYYIFFPPYSMNWWDCAYVNGQLEEKFYILYQILPELLRYDNVQVYYFQNDADVICNLDNYMDLVHYSPEINQYMLERIAAEDGRVTRENWQEVIQGMWELVQQIDEELIYQYYSKQ